jgi:hypothetical protein
MNDIVVTNDGGPFTISVPLQGPQGIAATVAIGTVTTGAAGSSAAVANGGTPNAAVLNFTIPRGNAGAPGGTGATGPGYAAMSTTSLACAGAGSKTFATQTGLAYSAGARIRATSAGTGEWMEGVVTAYSGGSLTATMDSNSGTGTHADWTINLAGQQGQVGPNGNVPVGATIFVTGTVAPNGFLKANGSLLSRTTYAALWAYAQASGRVVSDATWTASDWGAFSSGDGSTTFRLPDLRAEFIRGLDDGRGVDSGRLLGSGQADDFKAHAHTISVSGGAAGGGGGEFAQGSSTLPTSTIGGTETRPRNIALLACIKY